MFFVYVGYKPVTLLIMALGFSASFGYLIARLIGIALEGADNKQWIYLGTEVVLAVALYVWFDKLKKSVAAASAEDA